MRHPTKLLTIAAAVGLALPLAVVFRDVPPGTASGHPAVYATAWAACLLWFASAWRGMGEGVPPPGPWACGAVAAGVHVAVAMHCAHGWSRDAAYAEIARTGGFAGGLYVNDAFVAVWVADAVWLCATGGSYGRRPRWVGVAVHGFLAFIVFNAVVVFGSWPTRVVGIVAFGWMGWKAMGRGRRGFQRG